MSAFDTSGTVSAPTTPVARTLVSRPALSTILRDRAADYLQMSKPKIAVLAMITVTVGFAIGQTAFPNWPLLPTALVGIALVAVSSSVLNQYIERDSDRLMDRTADRPLPDGRIHPLEALALGILSGVAGVLMLWLLVNPLTAALSLLTLLLYVAAYTPLKRSTTLATTIGAIPGAMPPVLGYVAATGEMNSTAWSLFGILFLWQFPHFLAIGWLYRQQYAQAGLKMLPAGWERPRVVGGFAVIYAIALIPVSLLPSVAGFAGGAYFTTALVLGAGYLFCSIQFLRAESRVSARRLLWSSLIYLPLLLLVLTWDHYRLLS